MAGLKFNKIFPDIIKKIKQLQRDVIKLSAKPASKAMEKDIVASIERGNSPVQGQGRFDKYSDSYTKAIKGGSYPGKKLRPVNLKLTGELLKSIGSKITSKGFDIFFKKKVKGKSLADIHSFEGAGKSKTIRMMIPEDDGDFKKAVKKNAEKIVKAAVKKVIDRNLRRYK